MKINQRGFTLIELLIFIGVLAVVGVWVATQGNNVLTGSKTERAYQQIETIMKAADSYKNSPARRGSYEGISITQLVDLGYPMEPFSTGVNQNVYGLSASISGNSVWAIITYATPEPRVCEQLRTRLTNLTNRSVGNQPTCSNSAITIRLE